MFELTSPLKEGYTVTESVFKLSQPGMVSDPLTELLRSGARSLLAHTIDWEEVSRGRILLLTGNFQ